ncbi:hypothetical protein, partial [Pectobacterium brasiliense]|uniref:hypothetical protein n=1 Tax=Pectobacterium brasiliense TaxID=180957 RepID=UPI00196971AA
QSGIPPCRPTSISTLHIICIIVIRVVAMLIGLLISEARHECGFFGLNGTASFVPTAQINK